MAAPLSSSPQTSSMKGTKSQSAQSASKGSKDKTITMSIAAGSGGGSQPALVSEQDEGDRDTAMAVQKTLGVGEAGQEDKLSLLSPTTTLDFGNVPSQQTVKKSLLIRHTHSNPNTAMILNCHPLDPYGAYTIIRPPQQVLRNVGDTTEVIIKFQPTQEALYEQTLRIACEIVPIVAEGNGSSTAGAYANQNEGTSGKGKRAGEASSPSALPSNSSSLALATTLPSSGTVVEKIKFCAPISRHFVVARLTGRGQPAALTITRAPQTSPSTVAGVGSSGGALPPSSSGGTTSKQGSLGAASPPPPTRVSGGGNLLSGASLPSSLVPHHDHQQDVFSDIATAHEKLDQLHATLRGVPMHLVVDMGTCVAGDVLERCYDFTNCSEFALTVRSEVIRVLNRNPNHLCPFTLNPSHVTIPPRASVPVTFAFSPTVDGLFGAIAKIKFGGQDSYHEVSLSGRATDKGLFIIPPHNKNANAVSCSNPVISTLGGPSGVSVSSTSAQNPFSVFGGDSSSPSLGAPPLPLATAGLVTRREGLSALLSLLPSASVAVPGSDALHPLSLNFSTTAVRTFDKDANAESSPTISPQKSSEKERKKAEERRLKKELAAAQAAAAQQSSGTASGSNTARSANGGRTPRQMVQAQAKREDDGPGLSCTISSTTATHQIVIGNNRSSTPGEFVVEGLTETDVSYGWKVNIVSVATDDGGGLVSGASTVGVVSPLGLSSSSPNASISGGASAVAAGAPAVGGQTTAAGPTGSSSKGGAAVPPPIAVIPTPGAIPPIRGTLAPGVSALVHVTFTPLQALIESLPLDGVDIVALADLRITVRGGTPATPLEGRVLHLQLKGVVKNGSK